MKRRKRKPNKLANRLVILGIMEKVSEKFFPDADFSKKKIRKFLLSVAQTERYSLKEGNFGRPGNFPRQTLLEASAFLKGILEDVADGRVSVYTFANQYVPIVFFPSDIIKLFESNQITLKESHYLNRIRLYKVRKRIISKHIQRQGSQNDLLRLVKSVLGENEVREVKIVEKLLQSELIEADELLKLHPSDTTHLVWEDMKACVYLLKEADATFLEEEEVEKLLNLTNSVQLLLQKAVKRKEEFGLRA